MLSPTDTHTHTHVVGLVAADVTRLTLRLVCYVAPVVDLIAGWVGSHVCYLVYVAGYGWVVAVA